MVAFRISGGELDRAMNMASRRISREVSIPGFRPGRAPRRLVERRVGADRLRSDALEDLVPSRMGRILSGTGIAPVLPPLLESVTDADNGALRVEVRVTTWPRLDSPPEYRDRRVEVSRPPDASEEVEQRLQQLRHMYAPLQPVERPIERGDFVVVDMTVTEGGRPVEALALDGFSYEVGSERLTGRIDESLVGREVGDDIRVTAALPDWLQPEVEAQAEDWDDEWDDDDLVEAEMSDAGETAEGTYEISIVEVQSRSLPEVDDDWASEYTGHDSLEELKEEMSQEVADQRIAAEWEMLVNVTVGEVLSDMELELPERLQTAQMELLFRNHLVSLERAGVDHAGYLERTGMTPEQFLEGLRSQAAAVIKSRVLTESVIEAEGLEVGDDELLEVLRRAAREAEDPEAFQKQMAGGDHVEQVRSDMLRARAQAVMAMAVRPVDSDGHPVEIEAPSWVKAWFNPATAPGEIGDGQGDARQSLYEAEVIDDPEDD